MTLNQKPSSNPRRSTNGCRSGPEPWVGINALQSFTPTPEGAQLAVLAGRVAVNALAVAQATWVG